LKRLSEAVGVSGGEEPVRSIVRESLDDWKENIRIDAMGNLLLSRRGKGKNRARVMIAAHMDEVGMMLTYDDGDGLYRFETVGGIDPRQLVGKPVWIGKRRIPGVIGTKPIHLTPPYELRRTIPIDKLRIDVGPSGSSEVKIGDRATFATPFTRMGPSLRGKALDDRLGVATLIELVRNAPPNIDLLAAFTVQEEVGLRGARVAAYALNPDLAIALDSTPAYDLPAPEEGLENEQYNARLGAGPAIYLADGATLSNPRLIRHLVETAEARGISYQFRQPGRGGTDAGAIHQQRSGIPSVSVSVPARYNHTAAAIARLSDWQATYELIHAALSDLKAERWNQHEART
jgi:endoglucanase